MAEDRCSRSSTARPSSPSNGRLSFVTGRVEDHAPGTELDTHSRPVPSSPSHFTSTAACGLRLAACFVACSLLPAVCERQEKRRMHRGRHLGAKRCSSRRFRSVRTCIEKVHSPFGLSQLHDCRRFSLPRPLPVTTFQVERLSRSRFPTLMLFHALQHK